MVSKIDDALALIETEIEETAEGAATLRAAADRLLAHAQRIESARGRAAVLDRLAGMIGDG